MVRWVALFWGFVAFFPVGLNYTAFVLLGVTMAWEGGLGERLARLRQTPYWWPAWAFLGWAALALLLGPHYPETASNALHALRIVLTLALALALARDEALWALRGFVLGLVVSLLLAGLNEAVALPATPLWNSIIRYDGNKSLANAVQMALAAVSALLLLPALGARGRLAAALLASGLLLVLVGVLHSRTAWLVVVLGLGVGLLHRLRGRRRQQLVALAAAATLALAAGLLLPGVKQRVQQGAGELASAYQGQTVHMDSSWGIRYRMYRETTAMIAERPLLGWGIGGWSTQWRQRVDGPLTEVNMPHNDFLWMGAQAGVPGALALLWLLLAGWPAAWRRHDLNGCLAAVALLAMLLAVLGNSALRDASMGLSLWFIVLVIQRLASQPQPLWQGLWPGAAALPARR